MRKIIVFETAKEFFDACFQGARHIDDDSLQLPQGTNIVSDGGRLELQGKGMENFTLAGDITIEHLTEEAFSRLGTSVYFT